MDGATGSPCKGEEQKLQADRFQPWRRKTFPTTAATMMTWTISRVGEFHVTEGDQQTAGWPY